MIYIMSETNEILIPKHTSNNSKIMGLSLENNLTHSHFFYELEDEFNGENGIFYKFVIPDEIKKLEIGEYTYSIYKDVKTYEKGLLNIGNYIQNKTEYHNNDKKIVQYNG